MTTAWWFAATAATLAYALLAGVFFAFSGFVTTGLHALGAPRASEAMRAINDAVPASAFGLLLLASVAVSGVLVVGYGVPSDVSGTPAAGVAALAAVTFLSGGFGVTLLANVPLNRRLAADPGLDWTAYRRHWVGWNHVRTLACIVAFACAVAAVVLAARDAPFIDEGEPHVRATVARRA